MLGLSVIAGGGIGGGGVAVGDGTHTTMVDWLGAVVRGWLRYDCLLTGGVGCDVMSASTRELGDGLLDVVHQGSGPMGSAVW